MQVAGKVAAAFQLSAASVLRNSPPAPYPHSSSPVPAYTLPAMSGSTASAITQSEGYSSLSPELARRQVAPLSTLLNSPESVPAYHVPGFWGSAANESNWIARSPAFAVLQLTPPSVLFNTPPSQLAAYRVLASPGSIAKELAEAGSAPPVDLQLAAPSVLLYISRSKVTTYNALGRRPSRTAPNRQHPELPSGRWGSPALAAPQLAASSVLLKTPIDVARYTVPNLTAPRVLNGLGSIVSPMAKAPDGRPAAAVLQLAPPSTLFATRVARGFETNPAAYIVPVWSGSIAIGPPMNLSGSPALTALHPTPPSVLL